MCVCVCVCRCEPLDLFPDWLRPLHKLTMEMLAQEKLLYSGASCRSAEGVAEAANFSICFSLNGGNYWELPIVPDCSLEEGGGGVLSWALLSAAPCRQCGEVTEGWSGLGSHRMESGEPRIPAGGAGPIGPSEVT